MTGPHLIIHNGARTIALDGGHWTVGRSADNFIVIDEGSISRKHAMLQRLEDDQLYVIDLGSRNGTFVNDRRVTVPTTIRDGDQIRFGMVECTFYWPGASQPQAKVAEGQATSLLQVRRLISVLVIDIRDYTGLTRRTDEQLLSRVMADWFRQVGEIVHAAGGYIDKHIGDAVMSVWFHAQDRAEPQDLLRVVRALDAINTATSHLHETFGLPAPIRIAAGVNTGFAVIVNTGTAERPDYTALGDTVNAAFRIEGATRPLARNVAIGESSWEQLRIAVGEDLFERHTIELKGYDQPLSIYAADFPDIALLLRRAET